MPTAVITGANSGIGNALAKLLVNEGYKVIAADIQLGNPINELGCEVFKLDIASPEGIQAFKEQIGEQPIDILLNVAGVMERPEADTLETIDLSKLQRTFAVNTFGSLLLTQALLPGILLSPHPRIAVISSRVGSIGDNTSGGSYSYRASKAAVNQLFKSMAVDLKEKNVPVFILHPGMVKTTLANKWKDEDNDDYPLMAIEPEVSAASMWRVLMSKGLESTGRFYSRTGEELPW